MKRIWIWIIFGIWVLGLFFLGIMVGRSYQFSPIAEGIYQDSPVNHDKSQLLIEKVKPFLVGLADASDRVGHRLDSKWQTLIDDFRYFSRTAIRRVAILVKGVKVGDGVSKAPENVEQERIDDDQISHLEANIPFPLDSYIEDQLQNHTSGRLDPFLDIVALKKASESQLLSTGPTNNDEGQQEPNPDNVPEERPLQTNPLSGFSLRGIVIGKSRVAYIEDQNGYQKVTVGDELAGGKIIGITKETVIIQIGKQLITLTEEGSR